MTAHAGIELLLTWLPRLGLRWEGYRRVHKQVTKRIGKRVGELGLPDVMAYGRYLEEHPEELTVMEAMCRVTISRFNRDAAVFDWLVNHGMPRLLQDRDGLRIWSAGCASGEEPFTLSILWHHVLLPHHPQTRCQIVATDANATVLQRAAQAQYESGSMKELPPELKKLAFDEHGRLHSRYRELVRFSQQDLLLEWPSGSFDVVLCRNVAFTYFDQAGQQRVLHHLVDRMVDGGVLVIGLKEQLPPGEFGLVALRPELGIFTKQQDG